MESSSLSSGSLTSFYDSELEMDPLRTMSALSRRAHHGDNSIISSEGHSQPSFDLTLCPKADENTNAEEYIGENDRSNGIQGDPTSYALFDSRLIGIHRLNIEAAIPKHRKLSDRVVAKFLMEGTHPRFLKEYEADFDEDGQVNLERENWGHPSVDSKTGAVHVTMSGHILCGGGPWKMDFTVCGIKPLAYIRSEAEVLAKRAHDRDEKDWHRFLPEGHPWHGPEEAKDMAKDQEGYEADREGDLEKKPVEVGIHEDSDNEDSYAQNEDNEDAGYAHSGDETSFLHDDSNEDDDDEVEIKGDDTINSARSSMASMDSNFARLGEFDFGFGKPKTPTKKTPIKKTRSAGSGGFGESASDYEKAVDRNSHVLCDDLLAMMEGL